MAVPVLRQHATRQHRIEDTGPRRREQHATLEPSWYAQFTPEHTRRHGHIRVVGSEALLSKVIRDTKRSNILQPRQQAAGIAVHCHLLHVGCRFTVELHCGHHLPQADSKLITPVTAPTNLSAVAQGLHDHHAALAESGEIRLPIGRQVDAEPLCTDALTVL